MLNNISCVINAFDVFKNHFWKINVEDCVRTQRISLTKLGFVVVVLKSSLTAESWESGEDGKILSVHISMWWLWWANEWGEGDTIWRDFADEKLFKDVRKIKWKWILSDDLWFHAFMIYNTGNAQLMESWRKQTWQELSEIKRNFRSKAKNVLKMWVEMGIEIFADKLTFFRWNETF